MDFNQRRSKYTDLFVFRRDLTIGNYYENVIFTSLFNDLNCLVDDWNKIRWPTHGDTANYLVVKGKNSLKTMTRHIDVSLEEMKEVLSKRKNMCMTERIQDGRKEGRKKGKKEGWKERRKEGRKDRRKERRKERKKEEWKERRKEGWKDGRKEGWKEGELLLHLTTSKTLPLS